MTYRETVVATFVCCTGVDSKFQVPSFTGVSIGLAALRSDVGSDWARNRLVCAVSACPVAGFRLRSVGWYQVRVERIRKSVRASVWLRKIAVRIHLATAPSSAAWSCARTRSPVALVAQYITSLHATHKPPASATRHKQGVVDGEISKHFRQPS